jgi:predicted RNA binding protein YcfA (HicA-like mRNA interferase family)
MGKLKQLSGREVVSIFKASGFILKRKTGSHFRMTLYKNGRSHHVTIPQHDGLRKGTLRAITRIFEMCFGKEETQKHFYTE